APPSDIIPHGLGGRVPERVHAAAEGPRRQHSAAGAPARRRLAGNLGLAKDQRAPVLGRRGGAGDAERLGAAGRERARTDGSSGNCHERRRIMSLRYTGEATMDEPVLREVERWKDKIEVRLDNRQVFFLFFGSAMV